MRIAVLFGGTSEEREVSVASAAQIIPALRTLGHAVHAVDLATGRLQAPAERQLLMSRVAPAPPSVNVLAPLRARTVRSSPMPMEASATDLVFLALHGGAGEDGHVQALLDWYGVPYTGSNHAASAAAMDKDLAKCLFRSAAVPTPDWLMAPTDQTHVGETLGWPVIVKPNKQGSTIGLTVVRKSGEFAAAMQVAGNFDDEVMVEKFIAGREFTVGILEGQPLPVGEILAPGEVFDYKSKYQAGVAREQFPAQLRHAEATRLQDYALRAHRALKLGAYSRVDFRQDTLGQFWCLEANSLPGMTAISLLPQAAKAAGIDFATLLERICQGAIRPR